MRFTLPAGLWPTLVVGLLLVSALPVAAAPALEDSTVSDAPSVVLQSNETPTDSPTPEPTATESPTPEPTATESPTPEPTATESPTPTDSPTPESTPTESPTPEPTPTDSPTPEPTATESPTPEPTPTESPTPEPTATESPTPEPTATESPTPGQTTTTETTTQSPAPTSSDGGSGGDGGDGGSDGDDEDSGDSDDGGSAGDGGSGSSDDSDDDDDRRRGAGKARQLGDRLTDSVDATGAGEFQRAQRLIGENYTQTLSTYESLSNKGGAVDAFAGAQSSQQTYITIIREYERTRQQYRTAEQNGNDSGTRQLSRKLTRLADASNLTAARLQQNYSRIEGRTSVSLDSASSTVRAGQQWVAEQQAQIDPAELTRTRLQVETDADRVSFSSPATIRGTLTAANGSAIADRTVAFEIDGQRVTTETDGSGQFAFEYRPTTAKPTDGVTVTYVPLETSPYTRASSDLSLRVEQTTGTLSLSEAPSDARFDDGVTVRGRVVVDGTPVPGVPVEIRLGNTTLGTNETGADGRFAVTTRLPASVPSGEQPLTASLAMQDRAVTAETAQARVSVAKTSTALTVAVEETTQERVFLSGTLLTDDDTAVDGQQVQFLVEGTVVGTATTGSSGAYETNVSRSDLRAATDADEASLQAVYPAENANLEASRTNVTVPVGGGGLGSLVDFGGGSSLLMAVAGAVLLLFLLLAAWGILRFGAAGVDTDGEDGDDGDGGDDDPSSIGAATTVSQSEVTDDATTTDDTTTASDRPDGNQFSWSDVPDSDDSTTADAQSSQRPVTFDDSTGNSATSSAAAASGAAAASAESAESTESVESSEPSASAESPQTAETSQSPDAAESPELSATTDESAEPTDSVDSVESPDSGGVDDVGQQLTLAREALAEGEYQTAVGRAYETAREYVQTRYDFDAVDSLSSSSSPEAFYETCHTHDTIDEETLSHLDDLTQLQDKALYGYGSVSEEEAESAVSHAAAVAGNDRTNTSS
ncbi:hypothetical protein SAMN04487950_0306 [Halogranum rubrum]|uniref:Carboxypeptidase regulatory-like domain-containing protein n=1 Tax=Halogranum rubrum TaxID=553466 RepID=A0A1I4B5P1_9EURY|nr:hypothetical protein [Halogranum rubrum]SFK63680.1 hypothetical protein SAMN04487950_0306 [Halogranum rubrum]